MANPTEQSKLLGEKTASVGALLGAFALHSIAIMLIFALTLWPFLTGRVGSIIAFLGVPEFFHATVPTIIGHLVISSVLWALAYGSWIQWSKRSKAPRVLRTTRATVITETIIVLPLLLLLILGMAQLAVNSAAGMLANLAAYEAARSVWVWHPEKNRFGGGNFSPNVDDEFVAEMGRIQGAAVMTPVAFSFGTDGDDSSQFREMRGAILASQLDITAPNAGGQGLTKADDLDELGHAWFGESGEHGRTVVGALDAANYPVRSVMKLSGAYVATEVSFETRPHEDGMELIETEMTYRHFQAFGLVGAIFGTDQTVGGRQGWYSTYRRSFSLVRQVDSHPGIP